MPLAAPATSIAVGLRHACASLVDGEIWCWGANDYGQLGNGTVSDTCAPERVHLEVVGDDLRPRPGS